MEANYRGKGKWYKGKITKMLPNGSYDIQYNDGDSEKSVKPEFVRLIAQTLPGPPPGFAFTVGMQIEARYHGKKRWYAGAIAKVNGDGTYDIRYTDGDSERGLKAEYVRAVEARSINSPSCT